MKNWFTYCLRIALVLSAIFAFEKTSFSQSEWIELLPGSERLSYDEKSGIERLTGLLTFKYQNNIMYCDSAHLKRSTKEVWAYGNVQLNNNDTLNLFCDSIYYNGKTKKAKLWGHVRVRDREYKLSADTVEYDAKLKRASYKNGGKIENITRDEVLTSKYGYFHPNTEESFFRGNVVYKSPEVKMTTDTLQYNYLLHRVYFFGPTNVTNKETKLYCEKGWYNVETEEGVLRSNAWIDQETKRIEGDSLYYAPLKKIGVAKGNVKIFEKKENLELRAGYVHSDELKGLDVLTENPVVIWKRTKDTLFVRADTLKHFRDTLNKTTRLIGNREIKLFQNDIQAIADSLDYQKDKGEMKLWSGAHFWSKNSELTGDTISVYFLQDTILDRVFLRNNAFAANEVDSGRFYNQLAGKEMWAYFKDKELIKSTVNGNAETLFYPIQKEETDSTIVEKRLGMNRLIASQLKVILDSGEVKGVTFIEQPEGIFYPIDQLVEELKFLKSFKWNPALRPKTYKELIKSEL